MKFPIKIFLMTALLLAGYYCLLKMTGLKPRTAESNYVANQIRLQAMEHESGQLNIVMAGSSLTARLNAQLIEGDDISLNIGLDGSNAIFVANELIDSGKRPRVLLVEINTIYINTVENNQSLTQGIESGTNKLAKYFPLVRAESRPITILYSQLKSFKDSKLSTSLRPEDYKEILPTRQYTSGGGLDDYIPCPKLEDLIKKATNNKIRLVLMVMPDGVGKPFKYGKLLEKMNNKYDVEVLDLKTPFSDELVYTDGLHLSEPSANFLTGVIANALKE